jgi:hypothetical protein
MFFIIIISGGRTIHLENEHMDVNVIPVPEPVVRISGTSDISREYEDFKLGVRIFADVHIVMTTGSPSGNGNYNRYFLSICFHRKNKKKNQKKSKKMFRIQLHWGGGLGALGPLVWEEIETEQTILKGLVKLFL